MSQQEKPPAFGPSQNDPPNRGRGPTLQKALDNAIERMGAHHGDVFEVTFFVSVSNPHVGEYIADLG
jgi:hypothetical protein